MSKVEAMVCWGDTYLSGKYQLKILKNPLRFKE